MHLQLQFEKQQIQCLHTVKREFQSQEQTQEVRITDGMPDIGSIIGVWGQVILRTKEWQHSSAGINGGVQVSVLYIPENGEDVQMVETWVPFQVKWDLPDMDAEGTACVSCLLRSADGRNTSSRKILVRVNVGVCGQLWEPAEVWQYMPPELPEDICLLKKSRSFCIPREMGEKAFSLEEELVLPGSAPKIEKILHYHLRPELIEQKIMSDKVVFRGVGLLHMLYRGEDGGLHTWDFELPFSQYGELEREYDGHATSDVLPVVTNLEVDVQDNGTLRLKAGLVGQYVIYDTAIVDVVTDAYSNRRAVTLQRNELKLPAVLEIKQEVLSVESADESLPDETLDMRMLLQHPSLSRIGDGWLMEIPGSFQLLGRDDNDNLVSSHIRWENKRDILSDAKAAVIVRSSQKEKLKKMGSNLAGEITVDMTITTETDIPMIESLELGELQRPDENRPSLILRRVGKDSLWEIAKSCGSSVEDIRLCNGIASDPTEESILLIPVS